MPSREIDPLQFRRACGKFPTGVAVITAVDEAGVPHGMTANSFTSVSLKPPLVLFCVDHRATVLRIFRSARVFGINILSSAQRQLSEQFAGRTADRFRGLGWSPGPAGAPRLEGVSAFIEADLFELLEAGDHTVFVVRTTQAALGEDPPLVYFDGDYAALAT